MQNIKMNKLKKYYELFPPIWDGCVAGELLGSGSFGDVYELINLKNTESPVEAFKEIAVPPPSAGGLSEAMFQGLDLVSFCGRNHPGATRQHRKRKLKGWKINSAPLSFILIILVLPHITIVIAGRDANQGTMEIA